MTDYYVYSGSAQDDSDANWNSSTLAFLDINTALGTAAAGDDIWVAHDHSKDYAATTTFNNNGTIALPIKITCVNRTTGAITTGAIEQATGAANALEWSEDNLIFDGVTFKSGNLLSNDTDSTIVFKNATMEFLTSAADPLNLTADDTKNIWENVEFKALGAASHIRVGGGLVFRWIDGGISSTSTALQDLIRSTGSRGSEITLIGLDLTNISTSIIQIGTSINQGIHNITLIGCKIHASLPILNSSSFSVPHEIIARSCDNGNGYYYFEETYLEGQIVQDTANYLDATYDGTNGYSAKMASNANALDSKRPLRYQLCEFWQATANPTITVEIITAGVTLQDDEFWLEIEYPNSTDEALRDIDDSSRQEVGWSGGSGPGTPSNLTSSSAAWTEVLASEVKQKIAVTLSGGARGMIRVFCCLAKASTTVYVDPKVTVS